ncbi:CDP-glycerol glycerophosphotransferase family protein [Geodermatophilus sp. URMC 60]
MRSQLVRAVAARTPRGVVTTGKRIAERLPGVVRDRIAPAGPPLLSVVLPIYNVEAYLPECLDSILSQDLTSFEVIVVDDGSPDGSLAIARAYARRDRRIRIVRQANAGLGAARNAGLRQATGRYLVFVDSDDRLPAGAFSALVGSCERSGSDLAVGSIVRFNSTRTWAPEWITTVHDQDRIGVTLKEFPALLRNNYTWCKVYRRSFWDECGLWFREGVAYEDQPIVSQLFVRASGIDVLSATVYEYRAREDASSISQQTGTVQDLRDRAAAWLVSREALRAEASEEVYEAWLQTLFSTHFHWYLDNASAIADEEYWQVLHATLADLAADVPEQVWHRTPPQRRVVIELVRRGLREEFLEFRRENGHRTESFPATVRNDGVLLHLPLQGRPEPGLPDELFVLRAEQLTVRHQVRRIRWVAEPGGRPRLVLEGHAHIPHIDLREHRTEVVATLCAETGDERLEVAATLLGDPALHPSGNADHAEYSPSALCLEIPTDALVEGRPGRRWRIELEVRTAGLTAATTLTEVASTGSAGLLEAFVDADGLRLVLDHRAKQPLRLYRDKPRPVVVDARLEGRELHAVVRPVPGRPLVAAHVVAPGAKDPGEEPQRVPVGAVSEDGTQEFLLQLPPLAEEAPPLGPVQRRWTLRAEAGNGSVAALTFPSAGVLTVAPQDGGSVLALERTRRGNLGVVEWRDAVAVVDGAEVTDDGVLVVSGRFEGGPAPVSLHVEGVLARTEPVAVEPHDGRFTARIPLTARRGRFGQLPLPAGKYWLDSVRDGGPAAAVVVDREPAQRFPQVFAAQRLEGRLTRTGWGRLQLNLLTPRGDAYRSKAAQTALATRSTAFLPERFDGLLLRSYFGESATDSGIGLVRELQRRGADLPVRWAVKDFSVPVPEGVEPVVHGSPEWHRLLRTSRYYMDNMYQPVFHDKPAGQVLVQTFHGYPFKLMGHAHWEAAGFSRTLVEAYDRRAAQWDYVVSPAPYATPLLRREFRYEGEVLEIGYPRNDALLAPDAETVRATVRRSLGVRDDQVAVLYAPTFRDYVSVDNHKAQLLDLLGMDALAEELGDGFVILNRSHAFNARSGERLGSRGTMLDVTDYPEVTDLYLAADVAVADYSSLRFDFAVTGKPMLFFVPDLERYREARGWLFDYEPTAPGPLIAERADLVAELRDLDGVRSRYAADYARFRRDYLPLEDGRASARLVDAVFVPRGDAPAR